MFAALEKINERPAPFAFYTASDLWTDEHTSAQMLSYHLNEDLDVSSRSGAFMDRSVSWIVSRFGIGRDAKIADFGCGPGLYTTRLARLGARVTGIDFSERSIAYAKKVANSEGLDIRYVQQNYLEFATEDRFDLILMIMCDFCALSPQQREGLLQTFYTLLKPGGAVLLDVYSLAAFERVKEIVMYERDQLNGFWSPDPYYAFLNTFKYEAEKVRLDKYTIVEVNRTRTVYNWLQHFSPEDLGKAFERAGFTVEGFYSDVAGAPFDPETEAFAIVGRKK
jgi:SAM-dependent methyltransferase